MKKVLSVLVLPLAATLAIIYISSCGFQSEPVAFVSATPSTGSTLQQNASITLTFDGEPTGLKVSAGTAITSGRNAIISGPFTPGPLALTLTWDDGSHVLNYTVEGEGRSTDPVTATPERGEVLFYTGEVWWITEAAAEREARTAITSLDSAPGGGIKSHLTHDEDEVKRWMLQTMHNRTVDVLVLYGDVPGTIYPPGNALPDGSVAEEWLETTDGDTILNHADWFFWGGGNGKNQEAGLQNIMDIPGITMWGQDTPMIVTNRGKALTPSLRNFSSDRPFHLDRLEGDWFAELILASNTGDERATRADPVIVRDGNLGRIAIVYQTQDEVNPKGTVAAEIIKNYLIK